MALQPFDRSNQIPSRATIPSITDAVAPLSRVPYIVYMSIRRLDTTADALEAQRSALGRLGPEGRVRAALDMSDSIRGIRLSGLRSRYPGASDRELILRLIAELHGVRPDSTG